MKKLFLLVVIISSTVSLLRAQKATLTVKIINSTATVCHLWIPGNGLYDYLKQGEFTIKLVEGKGAINIAVRKPVFAYLTYFDKDSSGLTRYSYKLYISPGNNLVIKANAANGAVAVSGVGSNNNQPLLSGITEPDENKFYGDTLPNRIIALANDYQKQLRAAYNQYIKTYKPSADFVKNAAEETNYTALKIYYDFKENNKYQIDAGYTRNQASWQKIQDSLLTKVKLNNSGALAAASYQEFLRDFVFREKARLWAEANSHPVEFFKEYYHTDTATGRKLYVADMQNLLDEKIVNKNFTGAVEEQGYALVIDDALGEHNPQNLVGIYDRLSIKYPRSVYVQLYKPVIDSVRQLERQSLSKDMVLLPQNGTSLKSFNEILALSKGKTVLLDMWGTWCGPCRNEIHDNSAAIKAYFKGKGLDYVYVANHDLEHADLWKKMIVYFDMKGTHILASKSLSKDIMDTVKGEGYPTYVIIKKDGSWELSKAGYPMKRDVLIQQLEAALAM